MLNHCLKLLWLTKLCKHTPLIKLESPFNLTCMLLECGRKPDYQVKTHLGTGRTYKLSIEKPLWSRQCKHHTTLL